MQLPVSTKGASPTAATTATSAVAGSVFGKASAAKRGSLPAFAEILAGESAEAGHAGQSQWIPGAPEIPGQAEKNATEETLEEGSQQLELPVAALHLPELIFAKADDVKAQAESNAVHGKTVTTNGTVTRGDKKEAASASKATASESSASSEGISLGQMAIPLAAPLPVAPVAVPVKQASAHGQISLSPSTTVRSSNSISLRTPSSALPDQEAEVKGHSLADGAPLLPGGEASASVKEGQLHNAAADFAIQKRESSGQQVQSASTASGAAEQSGAMEQSNPFVLRGQAEDDLHASALALHSAMPQPVVAESDATTLHAAAVKTKASTKSSEFSVNAASITPTGNNGAAHGAVSFNGGAASGGGAGSGNAAQSNAQPAVDSKAQAAASGNPFQHLDAGESPATLLRANAHEVSVGVRDPSLGWVEIQTQSSAGHVSASLTAASAEAHASLAAEVPALTQYLADRNVHVHAIGVSAQGGAGGGGQSQSGSGYTPEQASQGKTYPLEVAQPLRGISEDEGPLNVGRSSYISVRA